MRRPAHGVVVTALLLWGALPGPGCSTGFDGRYAAPLDAAAPTDAAAPADLTRSEDAARPDPPQLGATISLDDPPPPLFGGTLLVTRGGQRALVADPDRDRLLLVDLAGMKVAREIPLARGDEPGRAVEDAAGRLHLVLRRAGALASLDAGGTLTRRPACAAPRGIAYRARTDELLVACAGGELQLFEAGGSGGPRRTVHLERDLRDVVIDDASGLPFVSVLRTATLLVLDGDLRVSARLRPESPGSIPTVAWRLVARPGGGVLMAHQLSDTRVISTQEGGYGGGSLCAGAPRGTIVRSAITRFARGAPPAPTDTGELPGVVLPVDVAAAREGHIAVVSPGSARVAGMPQVAKVPSNLVAAPCAAWPDPEPIVGQAVAAAYDGEGNLWVQTREPAALLLREGPRRAALPEGGRAIALGGEARTDTGWEIFHTDSGARLACASCHPEGGDDGRTWRFDLGDRRTQWLRGGVGRRPPFHWNGDVTDIGELTDNVFSLRMLGPRLDGAQRTALAAWLDTIPSLPPPSSVDTMAAARGRALFQDAAVGCAGCHKGTQLTNDDLADIGREMPFKVQGLLDVADHPPYMHDGCAPTLRDRFRPECGGGNHGDVSMLAPAQLDDLVAYLESL